MSNDFWHNNFKIKPETPGTSQGFDLDSNDVLKLLRDAGVVGIAATVAYLASHVGDVNFGDSAYVAVPVLTILLNMLHKWVKDNGPNGRNNININEINVTDNRNIDRGGNNFRPDFGPNVRTPYDNRGRMNE